VGGGVGEGGREGVGNDEGGVVRVCWNDGPDDIYVQLNHG